MATAVNYGAVTLADVALTTKDELLEAFVKNLIRNSKAMGTVPFITKNVLSVINKKWKSLPPLQKRLLNEGYANYVKGTTEDESWEPAFVGGDIKIDKQLEDLDNAIESERALQTKMAIAGFAADWTNELFNGDRSSDAKTFIGLKQIASNWQASRQVINVASGGVPLDVAASATNQQIMLNALHKGLQYVGANKVIGNTQGSDNPGGGKVCIYANENTVLGISAFLRSAGLLNVTRDQFDRQFDAFGGFPLVDVGLQSDQATEIIPNTEDAGDAGNNATSIYIVRWDADDGLIGVQKNAMAVYDPLSGREMESMPAHLLRVDWATMIIPRSDYCVVRIKGIKNPASWTIGV